MNQYYADLIKKAEKGDVKAQSAVAAAYFDGSITGREEFSLGMDFAERAAKAGDAHAQYCLGIGFKSMGMYDESFNWFMKAAKQNHPESQANVAGFYFSGLSVNKDDNQAFYWANKAYKNGESCDAPTYLGILYMQGRVVKQDGIAAYKMFKLAANNGNEEAMNFKQTMEAQFPDLKRM